MALFLISKFLNAQKFKEVVNVPGKDKVELFQMAKKWAALTFVSAQDVIQLDDPQGGRLIIKAIYPYTERRSLIDIPFICEYSLIIESKDERYRYEFTDIGVKNDINSEKYPISEYYHTSTDSGVIMEFKSRGEPVPNNYKISQIAKQNKERVERFDTYFNNLILDLKKYMSKEEEEW